MSILKPQMFVRFICSSVLSVQRFEKASAFKQSLNIPQILGSKAVNLMLWQLHTKINQHTPDTQKQNCKCCGKLHVVGSSRFFLPSWKKCVLFYVSGAEFRMQTVQSVVSLILQIENCRFLMVWLNCRSS